ncbi:MAG TPA: DUF5926 family protein [Segeticoccus sp.]|uniref:DUF5926 family protein n=1 Tax=Segeticoccus sp. TaxID=2706531 RepID=UPI002D7E4D14|nr:DUF5926 family protein [Segeticoccus sp.]HET8601966.1 DUF5926 family protein [Segeticoccus sp.]
MGKASRRRKVRQQTANGQGESRQRDPQSLPAPFVARPFEGLPDETEWVALREVVPAGTASIRFTPPDGEPRDATVVSVLPLAWPGLHRGDGELLVALQSGNSSGDASRDVAQVLLTVASSEAGMPATTVPAPTAGTPRLQDLLDTSRPFELQVHQGFDFWVAEDADLDADGRASLERANAAAVPTTRLASVASAYWCRIGDRTHIRWVLPHAEDPATDALARLHGAGASALSDGSRLLGAFRACGLLVPVWDLDPAKEADAYEEPMATFAKRFEEAYASDEALTPEERRARNGILSRQVTLR